MVVEEMLYLPSDEDPMPKGPAKKNKRRWCGGHEGREHIPVVTKATWAGGWQCGYKENRWHKNHYAPKEYYACWHEVTCEKCHKTLKYRSDSCPDRPYALQEYLKKKENI